MVNGRGAVPSRNPKPQDGSHWAGDNSFPNGGSVATRTLDRICDEQGIDRIEPATTYATSTTCSTAGRSTVSSRTAISSVPIGSYQERWEIPMYYELRGDP